MAPQKRRQIDIPLLVALGAFIVFVALLFTGCSSMDLSREATEANYHGWRTMQDELEEGRLVIVDPETGEPDATSQGAFDAFIDSHTHLAEEMMLNARKNGRDEDDNANNSDEPHE